MFVRRIGQKNVALVIINVLFVERPVSDALL